MWTRTAHDMKLRNELLTKINNCDTLKQDSKNSTRSKQQQMINRFRFSNLPSSWLLLLGILALSVQSITPIAGQSSGVDNNSQSTPETTTTGSNVNSVSGSTESSAASVSSTQLPVAADGSLATTTSSSVGGNERSAKPKIPALNFSRVDELFGETLNETEVIAKWKALDKNLVDGVRSILKMVFPHVVAMSSDAKVSGACSGAILKWILNLRNLRTWAVKLLDASGKPGPGILEGSLSMLGNYRQCLEVRAPDEDEIELADGEYREYFRGQYCVLQMRPHLAQKPAYFSLNSTMPNLLRKSYKYYEKNVYDDLAELALAFNFVHIRADLCVPSLCSRDDIQRVADFLAKKADLRARVARCQSEPIGGSKRLDSHQIGWLLIIAGFLSLVVFSTLAHWSMVRSSNQEGGFEGVNSHRLTSLLCSMSIANSWSHMKSVHLERVNNKKPIFLYAIKLAILLWILLVGLISQIEFQFMREMLPLRDMIMSLPMQFLVNSSLQFDTLILIAAFIYSYENINSNFIDLLKYNVAKYWRLMPSIMLLTALTIITPLLYQSKSPIWDDFVDGPAEACKSNGYLNLFFIQNELLNYKDICLPQTWIFCVELQLSLLTIPLVYQLNGHFDRNHGKFSLTSKPVVQLISMIGLGCLLNYINVYYHSLPPAWFLTFPDKEDRSQYYSLHLARTSSHLISFATGILCGHLCRCRSVNNFSGRPYGRKSCHALMVATAGLLMGAIIFGTHAWSLSGRAHLDWPLASALYASLAPLGWSLAWSLILFRLVVPSWSSEKSEEAASGTLSSLLQSSGPLLVRLGRLGFLAYLINPYINMLVFAVQEQTIFSSIIMMAHTYIGNVFFTFLLAFFVSLLVELPARRFIKKILLGSKRHCTNFGIMAREMDIHQREMTSHGHGHDSFMGAQRP